MQRIITSSYEHALARAYHKIDWRGIYVNPDKLSEFKKKVIQARTTKLTELSDLLNIRCFVGKEETKGTKGLNFNHSPSLLARLKELGYNIPKNRTKDKETLEVEWKDSADELALRRAAANYSQDVPKLLTLSTIIDIRELGTMLTRYVNARLYDNVYYSNYDPSGKTFLYFG